MWKDRLLSLLVLLFVLFLLAMLAVTSRAQQLNPGGAIGGNPGGIFQWLMVGPVVGPAPVPGTVNALQYQVNGTPLGTTNLADVTVGPWTPTLTATTPGTPIYTVQSGSFEKIGRQVTARFYLATGSLGGMAGTAVSIGGLPYPNTTTPNDMGICDITMYTGVTLNTGYTELSALVGIGQQAAPLYGAGSAQPPTTLNVGNFAASVILIGMCSYHV